MKIKPTNDNKNTNLKSSLRREVQQEHSGENKEEPNRFGGALEVVWAALRGYREDCISEGVDGNDLVWTEICTQMGAITNELERKTLKPYSRSDLVALLAANDKNGCYTDSEYLAENGELPKLHDLIDCALDQALISELMTLVVKDYMCGVCLGSGDGATHKCHSCNGQGVVGW